MIESVTYTSSFLRSAKKLRRKHYDMRKLETVIQLIVSGRTQELKSQYFDHFLKGSYQGFKELHIEPDWLLIYQIDHKQLKLFLIATGSHDDLFHSK